jgi:phosphoribosylglycinamide formyltransferase-1
VIVLSGFMKILPPSLVAKFQPRIINTHPSFLPDFPGAHAVKDALAAHVTATGASVIVVDDGVDTGAILAQGRVPVLPGDTEESLHARIKVLERQLLLDVLAELIPAT